MRYYLHFNTIGEIEEFKTKDTVFNSNNYSEYSFIENVKYNKYNYIILYNKNSAIKNITALPFLKNMEIYGDFLLFAIDSNSNIKSLTENKYMKLLNTVKINIEDYSSDDFNLSD